MDPILKERLAELLCIKNIITLLMTLIFGHMTVTGSLDGSEFLPMFSAIIAFYFGSQATPPSSPTKKP